MRFSSIDLFAGPATSPFGKGLRVAPGEGLRSLVRAAPPHPICCANRPLPAGERWTEHAEGTDCRNRNPGMTAAKYDVLGIGNAIFDVLVQTDESFLAAHGMAKGGMALIDEARAVSIYRDMGPAVEMSGGSAANTIVGIASFGARAAYVGKIRDDQIGGLYAHDIRAAGVAFETRPAPQGPATGCSYIL